VTRVLVAALVLGASGVAAAQTVVPTQLPPEVGQQVRVFEGALRAAIEGAAVRLAGRAREVVPDISLQFLPATGTRVDSLVMPDDTGYVFTIEAPAIEATSALFFEAFRRVNQANPRVANTPRGSDGAPAGTAPSGPDFSGPTLEYSQYVRQALIDTILDNGRSLPIKAGQTLTLVETGGQPMNPLAEAPRKLYLQVKGEDLLALRQGRITRDEASKRITQTVR